MSILNLKNTSLLKTKSYINGQWLDADSGKTFDVKDPASGKVIASVADLGVAETRRAIEAAEKAMQSWKKKCPKNGQIYYVSGMN